MQVQKRHSSVFSASIRQKGFTLLASMLILMLLSALSITLVYMITTERSIGSTDRDYSLAYYSAEAAMEKMMNDLGYLYSYQAAPTVTAISALGTSSYMPAFTNVSYSEYFFNVPNNNGTPITQVRNVSTGPNAGLIAQIIPMTLQVTAQRLPSNSQARLLRSVEVALIPVFQFGAFSESDIDFFPGPNFDFTGRVHSNGNVWLSVGGTAPSSVTLTFHDKVTSAGEIIRNYLENGVQVTTARTGTVYIP